MKLVRLTNPAADVLIASFVAEPGLRVKDCVAVARAPDEKVSTLVLDTKPVTVRPLNVATPLASTPVVVPESVEPPEIATVIAVAYPVTVLS